MGIGEKREFAGGYETITGHFHKNIHYEQLKKMVKKSKDIPEKSKEHTLKNLIKEDYTSIFLGDGRKYKYLFATAMFYRSYDIYTSSLLAYLWRNRVTINILLRSQFENMCVTCHYLKNKDEIKNAFHYEKRVDLKEARKCLAKWTADFAKDISFNEEYFREMYHSMSQKVHPFPEGLKSYFGGMHIMSRVRESSLPQWKPTLHVVPHHEEIHDKDETMTTINTSFVTVVGQLSELIKLDVDDEISDYSEIHRKSYPANENK